MSKDYVQEVKALTEQLEKEMTAFGKGNKSAGTRARGVLQDLKTLAQEARVYIQDTKNADKAE